MQALTFKLHTSEGCNWDNNQYEWVESIASEADDCFAVAMSQGSVAHWQLRDRDLEIDKKGEISHGKVKCLTVIPNHHLIVANAQSALYELEVQDANIVELNKSNHGSSFVALWSDASNLVAVRADGYWFSNTNHALPQPGQGADIEAHVSRGCLVPENGAAALVTYCVLDSGPILRMFNSQRALVFSIEPPANCNLSALSAANPGEHYRIIIGGYDGSLVFCSDSDRPPAWNALTVPTSKEGNQGEITAICMLRNGQLVVCGDAMGYVTLWRWHHHNYVYQVCKQAHAGELVTAIEELDRQHFATSSADQMVTVWKITQARAH